MGNNNNAFANTVIPVLDLAVSAWSQERNLEENANQARIQRQWQEEMWNKNNAYNTPLAQKKRLEEAGINPYAVLSQGGANTGVSSSPAQPYERMKANIQSPFHPEAFYNAQVSSAQTRGIQLDNDLKTTNLEFARVEAINRVQNLIEDWKLKAAQRRKENLNADYEEWQIRYFRDVYDSLVNQQQSQARISSIDAGWRYQQHLDDHLVKVLEQKVQQSNIAVNSKTIRKLASDIAANMAQVTYLGTMSDLNEKSIDQIVSSIRNDVRSRVSSRFRDNLEQEKFEFDITMDVLKTVMEANGVNFANLKFRGVQNKIKDVLKEKFPNLVRTNALDDFFSIAFGDATPSFNSSKRTGGVR